MRLIFLVFLCVSIFAAVPSKDDGLPPPKTAPDYKGVDPQIQPIVDEYKSLAKNHDIKFTHTVSVGFTDINHKEIVGMCNYGENFREIDVDKRYWKVSSETTRRTLLFHELTHCYCLRKHDWGKDKDYPEINRSSRVRKDSPMYVFISEGYFSDGCPLSIMYPYVLTDECFNAHKEHYDNEMFERCDPY